MADKKFKIRIKHPATEIVIEYSEEEVTKFKSRLVTFLGNDHLPFLEIIDKHGELHLLPTDFIKNSCFTIEKPLEKNINLSNIL